jgi:hypothetical protein
MKDDPRADQLRALGWRATSVEALTGAWLLWESPYGDLSFRSIEEAAEAAGVSTPEAIPDVGADR